MNHQAHLRGIPVKPFWKEGCPHRFGRVEGPDGCDANEGRTCLYETFEKKYGCEVFRQILQEVKAELSR